jgi:hypothetical protein
MFALLENDPDYVGIPTLDNSTRLQHSSDADDTVLGIGCESDIAPIERVLGVFCAASRQEIKPAKSFVMWLGQKSRWYKEVFGCLVSPLDTAIRYLGVRVGTNISQDDYWLFMLQSVPSTDLDWQTKGCSILGHTLIYNSCFARQNLV